MVYYSINTAPAVQARGSGKGDKMLKVRVWEGPEFDERTPEGNDGIACCDFVIEVSGLFFPGQFDDRGDQQAWSGAITNAPISRPISARRVYDATIENW